MSPWTVLEFLPLLPIDPALWPRWIPLEVLGAAIEYAPTRPAWRDAMRAKLAELHPGKKVRLPAFGSGKPPSEDRNPLTTSARLDELFAELSLRPALCRHPNATEAQLRAWWKADRTLARALLGNLWSPPDIVQDIFESTTDADEKRFAIEHPRATAAVLAHASDLQLVGNPATPSATIEAVLAKDQPPFRLSHHALTNPALTESIVAMLIERVGELSARNHPFAPATVTPGMSPHVLESLAASPASTREQFEAVLRRTPPVLNHTFWAMVMARRDLPLEWKVSLLDRLPPSLASIGLAVTLPAAVRSKAIDRILEGGSTQDRLGLVRAGGFDEATWKRLATAGRPLLDRMLLHREPLARDVALSVVEQTFPELAPFVRLHPDREGAKEGVMPGRWFVAGELLPTRGHLLAPPSTRAIKTVGVEQEDLVVCAHGTGLKTHLALVCRVRGALDDEAALKAWLEGLRWSDAKEIIWIRPETSAPKARTKPKARKPKALPDGPITAKALEAFLIGPKVKKGEATELIAAIRAFIAKEKPKRRRVLVDDQDSAQELGVWLLGSGDDRLVVIRRWAM